MTTILERIRLHAERQPDEPALRDEAGSLNYADLIFEVDRLATTLGGQRTGLMLDNGLPWACLDLAILQRGSVCVPIPSFFSDEQISHLIRDAGLDRIVTDRPERLAALLDEAALESIEVAGRTLAMFRPRLSAPPPVLPAGTAKVTYTSGTTGQPKGVCLSAMTIEAVTITLCEAVSASAADRCLSLLPLSTLLENIAGLYAPLRSGALAQIPSLAECGLFGSSGLQPEALFAALHMAAPTVAVLVPQLLKAIVGGILGGLQIPGSFRFIAVGGAPVAESLLQQARLFGLPAYQGFGLSEAGSVACLNLPGQERAGSVGKPLPHVRVRIADDGEVIVDGNLFLGYLGDTARTDETEWRTGDLGHLDDDGYLFLTGRKKTAYCTGFGRNVAPEWIEGALIAHPYIRQAAAYGEGRPFNVAVLVPRPGATHHELNQAIATVNGQLPDYARIGAWVAADHPFTPDNGQSNPSGCIRREAIHAHYREAIEHLYTTEEHHAFL